MFNYNFAKVADIYTHRDLVNITRQREYILSSNYNMYLICKDYPLQVIYLPFIHKGNRFLLK